MTRPVVLLDCDGVLSDFVRAAVGVVNLVVGSRRTVDQVTGFDFCRSLDLSDDEAAQVRRYISGCPRFADRLHPYSHAVDGVAALRAIAEVYVVTSPWNNNPTWTYDREAWLKRHLGVPHSHVIHTSAKHLVHGDALVDDKIDHVTSWRASHPLGASIHWRTPHNVDEIYDGLQTSSWTDVVAAVEAL